MPSIFDLETAGGKCFTPGSVSRSFATLVPADQWKAVTVKDALSCSVADVTITTPEGERPGRIVAIVVRDGVSIAVPPSTYPGMTEVRYLGGQANARIFTGSSPTQMSSGKFFPITTKEEVNVGEGFCTMLFVGGAPPSPRPTRERPPPLLPRPSARHPKPASAPPPARKSNAGGRIKTAPRAVSTNFVARARRFGGFFVTGLKFLSLER